MNINIKAIETLRDEREIREYFLSKNVNITNEEIYKLKENYVQTTNLSGNELSYEQLDGIAGGILYIFDGKVYSTLRDEFPKHMPEHVREAAQGLMSMQVDAYMNAIKFAHDPQKSTVLPYDAYTITIPPVLEIYREGSDYKLRFRRIGCDKHDLVPPPTHLREYAAREYYGKSCSSFPSAFLTRLAQEAFSNPAAKLKETKYYDASSPEAFELWQVAAANAGKLEGDTDSLKVYPKYHAYMTSDFPCFVHKVYRDDTFDFLYADEVRALFTDEHYNEAHDAGYVDNGFQSSIYFKFVTNGTAFSADSCLEHIPHDDVEAVTERYRALSSEHPDSTDEEKPHKPVSTVVETPERMHCSKLPFSERTHFFP